MYQAERLRTTAGVVCCAPDPLHASAHCYFRYSSERPSAASGSSVARDSTVSGTSNKALNTVSTEARQTSSVSLIVQMIGSGGLLRPASKFARTRVFALRTLIGVNGDFVNFQCGVGNVKRRTRLPGSTLDAWPSIAAIVLRLKRSLRDLNPTNEPSADVVSRYRRPREGRAIT
jgi:hypothetical protein